MAVSKSQQKAVNKYVREKYDRINITMQKGKKDTLQAHAAARGESANSFINRAIDQAMERDSAGTPTGATGVPTEAGGISLPSDTIKAAQEAAEAAGEAVPVFIARAVETQAQRDKASLAMGINPATGGRGGAEAGGTHGN